MKGFHSRWFLISPSKAENLKPKPMVEIGGVRYLSIYGNILFIMDLRLVTLRMLKDIL
jgi:hypothetical protein